MQVSVGIDTLFFKDNFYYDEELAYTYKIQKTPFQMEDITRKGCRVESS